MALSKNEIKFVQSLRLKKFRQKYDNFIAEGEKIADEVLRQEQFKVERIYAEADWFTFHASRLSNIPVHGQHEVSDAELGKISCLSTPNKVLMVVKAPEGEIPIVLGSEEKAIYLDDVQDPGNLGAILRIADWFGFGKVFCSPGSVEIYNPKVVQASMGAFLRVQSAAISLEAIRNANPGLPIIGAVLDGTSIFTQPLPHQGILVVGNESKGISVAAQNLLTHRVTIPRAEGGGAESLNAAVATGILAALWQRQ